MSIEPKRNRSRASTSGDTDDAASRWLSELERKQLDIDAWEPSLLRKYLLAQNRPRKRK
jgi:hypothetical protein